MVPFVVRVGLETSVIPGRAFYLDGVLAGLLFEELDDVEAAHAAIPLQKSCAVYAASRAFFEGLRGQSPVTIIQALRAEHDIDPDEYVPTGRGGRFPRIEVSRGPYRNQMSTYVAYEVAAVWWSGVGDVGVVRNLLEGALSLGTKRDVGYGQVRDVEIETTSFSHAGLMTSDGMPARPVPVELWEKLPGRADAPRDLERVTPPYWRGDRVHCAVPPGEFVCAEQPRIADLLGYGVPTANDAQRADL